MFGLTVLVNQSELKNVSNMFCIRESVRRDESEHDYSACEMTAVERNTD